MTNSIVSKKDIAHTAESLCKTILNAMLFATPVEGTQAYDEMQDSINRDTNNDDDDMSEWDRHIQDW